MPSDSRRRRIGFKGELLLAVLPTATVLLVLAFVEALTRQRLLFASLASSAFLIYLAPEHSVNHIRTLLVSQLGAAAIGFACFTVFGHGYAAGGTAMVLAIVGMIALDAMHPPAVATALSFALKAGDENNLLLFALAAGMTAILVVLERAALFMLRRFAATDAPRD